MRILVVEDEQDLLESLVEGLRLNSYAVDGCDDGCKAHELVSVVEYDLVVLDLNLPGMDGFQLLREIRTVNAEVKVLILSARDGLEDKVRGLDAGANDYLTKPFHFAELEARVRAPCAAGLPSRIDFSPSGALCWIPPPTRWRRPDSP